MQRGTFLGRAKPGPFQCLSCKTYVTGTESGHCPRCGFVPPRALDVRDSLRPIRGGTMLCVLAVIALAFLLALR